MALIRTLWDLYDASDDAGDSGVQYDFKWMMELFTINDSNNFHEAYQAIISNRTLSEKLSIGGILTEHRVAPAPTGPATSAWVSETVPPTFTWDPQGAKDYANNLTGFANNRFVVEVYNDSLTSVIFTSPEVTASSWTPTATEWAIIWGATGSTINWAVKGWQTSTPITGPYLGAKSSLRKALVSSVSVAPSSATVARGATRQLTATALYNNGASQDVTALASWQSSNSTVASVSTSGLVTANAVGTATITASYRGYSGSTTITVPRTITALSVSPSSITLSPGSGYQLTATAAYDDGTTTNVTSSAAWSSSNTAVASVSAGGYITASSTGTATIAAVYGGYSSSMTVTVTCSTGPSFDCPYSLSGSAGSSVNQGQSIYYKFYASAGTSYTVTLTPSYGDPDLTVYDPNRSTVGSSAAGTGVTDRVTFTASYTGYYYARVYGYSSAGYSISVTSGGGGGGGCSSGSSFDCAYTLSGSTSGSVSQGQSIYYQFYASAGTSYTVTLTPSYGDPDLTVYDPYRNTVGSSAAGTGVTDQVTFTASYTGYYYARVYGYSSAGYSLSVTSGGGGGGGGSGCSAGSSLNCAIDFGSSTSGSVSQGQSIYYRFYGYAGSPYTITLTPSAGDPDLYVYDPSQTQIGSSLAGSGSIDRVSFTAGSSGYYYIRVYGYSSAGYTLSR